MNTSYFQNRFGLIILFLSLGIMANESKNWFTGPSSAELDEIAINYPMKSFHYQMETFHPTLLGSNWSQGLSALSLRIRPDGYGSVELPLSLVFQTIGFSGIFMGNKDTSDHFSYLGGPFASTLFYLPVHLTNWHYYYGLHTNKVVPYFGQTTDAWVFGSNFINPHPNVSTATDIGILIKAKSYNKGDSYTIIRLQYEMYWADGHGGHYEHAISISIGLGAKYFAPLK